MVNKDTSTRKPRPPKAAAPASMDAISIQDGSRTLTPRAQIEWALRERVKELNCLYTISRLRELYPHSTDRFLQGVTECLPPAFQYIECACARITHQDHCYVSENFQTSRCKIGAAFQVDGRPAGMVEVFYRALPPGAGAEPFIRDEYVLMKAVAERIGTFVTHRKAEDDLQQAHEALQREHHALQDTNIALRTLLSRLEEQKREIEASILLNIQKLLMPIVYELELEVTGRQRSFVTLLRHNLQEIASPFLTQMCRDYVELTPVELAISTMIRNGLSTKEIAQLRAVSPATVRRHRENIRRKLKLTNRKLNLVTFLQAASGRTVESPVFATEERKPPAGLLEPPNRTRPASR
jgi:DNA-binding NarL/FixJ family response regulator